MTWCKQRNKLKIFEVKRNLFPSFVISLRFENIHLKLEKTDFTKTK